MARHMTMRAAVLMLCLAALVIPAFGQPSGGAGGSSATGEGDRQTGSTGGDKGAGTASAGRAGGGTAGIDAAGNGFAEFESWLTVSREGQKLASVRLRIIDIARPALEAGVPQEAFAARIREAVAKGVAADVIVQALEADASRWVWLAGLLRGSPWPPARTAADLYLAAASALRNGLGQEAVGDVVLYARSAGAPAEKAGAALTAAAAVLAVYREADAASGTLDAAASLIIHSRLKVGQYASIADAANRARSAGIDAARFMAALQATLGRGGTMTDLERALFG